MRFNPSHITKSSRIGHISSRIGHIHVFLIYRPPRRSCAVVFYEWAAHSACRCAPWSGTLGFEVLSAISSFCISNWSEHVVCSWIYPDYLLVCIVFLFVQSSCILCSSWSIYYVSRLMYMENLPYIKNNIKHIRPWHSGNVVTSSGVHLPLPIHEVVCFAQRLVSVGALTSFCRPIFSGSMLGFVVFYESQTRLGDL